MCVTPDGEKTEPELKKPSTESGDGKSVGFSVEGSAVAPIDGDSENIAVSGSFSCSASLLSMAAATLPAGSANVCACGQDELGWSQDELNKKS